MEVGWRGVLRGYLSSAKVEEPYWMWRFIFEAERFFQPNAVQWKRRKPKFSESVRTSPYPFEPQSTGKATEICFGLIDFVYPDHSKAFVGGVTRWSLSAPPQLGQVIERRGSRSVLGKTTLKPQGILIRELT